MKLGTRSIRHRFAAVALLTLICEGAIAVGWGGWGEVTQVEVVRGQGFLIFSSFTNVNSCTRDDGYLVAIDHPQYEQLYSMALSAMAAGWQLQPHFHECRSIGWHTGTYNTVTSGGAIFARR